MPKTKDANWLFTVNPLMFLRERFFRDRLKRKGIVFSSIFDNVPDMAIIANYDVRYLNFNSVTIEEKLFGIREIANALTAYQRKFLRQSHRIKRMQEKILNAYVYSNNDDDTFKKKIQRAKELLTYYSVALDSLRRLSDKAQEIIKAAEREFDTQYRREVGNRVRIARQAKGATQQDVATELKISRSMLAQFEKGNREISYPTLRRLLNFLEVSASEILGDWT